MYSVSVLLSVCKEEPAGIDFDVVYTSLGGLTDIHIHVDSLLLYSPAFNVAEVRKPTSRWSCGPSQQDTPAHLTTTNIAVTNHFHNGP
jgi:hypothetical protein